MTFTRLKFMRFSTRDKQTIIPSDVKAVKMLHLDGPVRVCIRKIHAFTRDWIPNQ